MFFLIAELNNISTYIKQLFQVSNTKTWLILHTFIRTIHGFIHVLKEYYINVYEGPIIFYFRLKTSPAPPFPICTSTLHILMRAQPFTTIVRVLC